jgi:hypothetical protein
MLLLAKDFLIFSNITAEFIHEKQFIGHDTELGIFGHGTYTFSTQFFDETGNAVITVFSRCFF